MTTCERREGAWRGRPKTCCRSFERPCCTGRHGVGPVLFSTQSVLSETHPCCPAFFVSEDATARFVATNKCERCWSIALTWAGEDFESLVEKKAHGDQRFSTQWKEADETVGLIETGESADKLFTNPIVVRSMRRSGIKTEGKYAFLTVKEYRSHYKLDPKLMKEDIVEVWDEENLKKLKGVVVKPSPQDRLKGYRRVTLWSETVWLIDEHVVPSHRRFGMVKSACYTQPVVSTKLQGCWTFRFLPFSNTLNWLTYVFWFCILAVRLSVPLVCTAFGAGVGLVKSQTVSPFSVVPEPPKVFL